MVMSWPTKLGIILMLAAAFTAADKEGNVNRGMRFNVFSIGAAVLIVGDWILDSKKK